MDAPIKRGPMAAQKERKQIRRSIERLEMASQSSQKTDVVYIWGLIHRKDFFKIGVTTSKDPMQRIRRVANQRGWAKQEVIMILKTGDPFGLESKLKRIGKSVSDWFPLSFDGRTEIRKFSSEELQLAVSISHQHAIDNKIKSGA